MMTPFTLLGLLIDTGRLYDKGKELKESRQWSDAANDLLETLDVLGAEFVAINSPHTRIKNLFAWGDVKKREWQAVVTELRQALGLVEEQVKGKLGADFFLPYDGAEIFRQIAEAKAWICHDEGLKLLDAWSLGNPRSGSRQRAIAKLRGAKDLFGICEMRGAWLQVTSLLTLIHLAPLAALVSTVTFFVLGVLLLTVHPTPEVTPTPTSTPVTVTFIITCADLKPHTVQAGETITLSAVNAVFIEPSATPKDWDALRGTLVKVPRKDKEFSYAPGGSGADMVTFTFIIDAKTGSVATKSLLIDIVTERRGLCYP